MKTLKKAVLVLGLNDKDTKKQIIETGDAFNTLSGLLCSRFAGATVTGCNGIYTHGDGSGAQVQENSFTIVLYFVTKKQVLDFAGELCRVFNQESIAIETVSAGVFGDRLQVEFFSL